MKLITAVFAPPTLQEVKDALTAFGVHGLTVSEVYADIGSQLRVEVYRGWRIASELRQCIRLEILATDDDVHDLVHIIRQVAGWTRDTGHGLLWVTPLDVVLRVRTGQYGADAV